MGNELFHADGQTGSMTKLIVAFPAILRIQLRYLIVMSSGVLTDTNIFLSVYFSFIIEDPNVAFFFQCFKPEVPKRTPVLHQCSP